MAIAQELEPTQITLDQDIEFPPGDLESQELPLES
ncbi:MAG: Uma2 family endonuclease, partial [Arthrospira sp. PLM2.Bin9]